MASHMLNIFDASYEDLQGLDQVSHVVAKELLILVASCRKDRRDVSLDELSQVSPKTPWKQMVSEGTVDLSFMDVGQASMLEEINKLVLAMKREKYVRHENHGITVTHVPFCREEEYKNVVREDSGVPKVKDQVNGISQVIGGTSVFSNLDDSLSLSQGQESPCCLPIHSSHCQLPLFQGQVSAHGSISSQYQLAHSQSSQSLPLEDQIYPLSQDQPSPFSQYPSIQPSRDQQIIPQGLTPFHQSKVSLREVQPNSPSDQSPIPSVQASSLSGHSFSTQGQSVSAQDKLASWPGHQISSSKGTSVSSTGQSVGTIGQSVSSPGQIVRSLSYPLPTQLDHRSPMCTPDHQVSGQQASITLGQQLPMSQGHQLPMSPDHELSMSPGHQSPDHQLPVPPGQQSPNSSDQLSPCSSGLLSLCPSSQQAICPSSQQVLCSSSQQSLGPLGHQLLSPSGQQIKLFGQQSSSVQGQSSTHWQSAHSSQTFQGHTVLPLLTPMSQSAQSFDSVKPVGPGAYHYHPFEGTHTVKHHASQPTRVLYHQMHCHVGRHDNTSQRYLTVVWDVWKANDKFKIPDQ